MMGIVFCWCASRHLLVIQLMYTGEWKKNELVSRVNQTKAYVRTDKLHPRSFYVWLSFSPPKHGTKHMECMVYIQCCMKNWLSGFWEETEWSADWLEVTFRTGGHHILELSLDTVNLQSPIRVVSEGGREGGRAGGRGRERGSKQGGRKRRTRYSNKDSIH